LGIELTSSFFNRDVNCIRKFFRKRFRYEGATWPTWKDVVEETAEEDAEAVAESEESADVAEGSAGPEDAESSTAWAKRVRLDLEVEASGFGRALQRELEDVSVTCGLC
jgi:RIO kinase 2